MYDKNGNELKAGDFVETTTRQTDGIAGTKVAMIGDINPSSAMVFFANDGVPFPVFSSLKTLTKVEPEKVELDEMNSLQTANKILQAMIREAKTV